MKLHHRCLSLITVFSLFLGCCSRGFADTTQTELQIMTNRHFDMMDRYANENKISIVSEETSGDIMDEIANGFVAKTKMSIFIFLMHMMACII